MRKMNIKDALPDKKGSQFTVLQSMGALVILHLQTSCSLRRSYCGLKMHATVGCAASPSPGPTSIVQCHKVVLLSLSPQILVAEFYW